MQTQRSTANRLCSQSPQQRAQDLLAAETSSQGVGGASPAGAGTLAPGAPGVPEAVAVLLGARCPRALQERRAGQHPVLANPEPWTDEWWLLGLSTIALLDMKALIKILFLLDRVLMFGEGRLILETLGYP